MSSTPRLFFFGKCIITTLMSCHMNESLFHSVVQSYKFVYKDPHQIISSVVLSRYLKRTSVDWLMFHAVSAVYQTTELIIVRHMFLLVVRILELPLVAFTN